MSSDTDLQTIALENQKQAENYLSQGKIEQAIACYKKVIEIQPEHWEIYQKLGDIYIQEENFSQAITIYQNAIKLNPNFN